MDKQQVYRSGQSLIEQINKTDIPKKAIAIWHLGQSGLVLKGQDIICLFDPYLSNYIEDQRLIEPKGLLNRNFDPPVLPEDVTNAEIIFITHDHLDHLDPETIEGISKFSTQVKFVCPAPSINKLKALGIDEEKLYAAKAFEVIKIKEVEVVPIPAKHEDFLFDQDGNHYYLGYILKTNDVTFYHAGDTILFNELINYLNPYSIGVAYLPINGKDWKRSEQGVLGNMSFQDAIELTQIVDIDLLVPVHYDLFDSNTENPSYFVDYLYRNYPSQKFKMMVPGERMIYLYEGNI